MGPYVFEENCWIFKKYINPTFPPHFANIFSVHLSPYRHQNKIPGLWLEKQIDFTIHANQNLKHPLAQTVPVCLRPQQWDILALQPSQCRSQTYRFQPLCVSQLHPDLSRSNSSLTATFFYLKQAWGSSAVGSFPKPINWTCRVWF